jgi:hypothetical protein
MTSLLKALSPNWRCSMMSKECKSENEKKVLKCIKMVMERKW